MKWQNSVARIRSLDRVWLERAAERQLQLTKPPGSLGRLEEVANRVVAMQETLTPSLERARIVLFAADHGVCAEGVNPYPQSVTAQMVANFLRGGAAINAIARAAGVELVVVDAGVVSEIPQGAGTYSNGLIRRPVARGTHNFCIGPAMTPEEASAALDLGVEMAEQALKDGCALLGIGEMGIGNSTSASALAAALTGHDAASVVGRGTGADEACMERKRSAVGRALAVHAGGLYEPLEILARLGGFEIGAMCGFCLGAAANRCVVLVDGFIATAAAALAAKFHEGARDYMIAAHRSSEPGHGPLLELLGLRPLLDLEMRLGEGTGAALAVPVVRAAVATLAGMATFESAGVANAESF